MQEVSTAFFYDTEKVQFDDEDKEDKAVKLTLAAFERQASRAE